MTAGNLPSVDVLRQMFRYEPESGILYWSSHLAESCFATRAAYLRTSKRFAGKPAGTIKRKPDGRPTGLSVQVSGRTLYVHRIIWAMVNGSIDPSLEVDHRDRNPLNNRLDNLRLATDSEQQSNTKNRRPVASGLRGVKVLRGKFQAYIKQHGKTRWLGTFRTKEEAHAAYCAAAAEVFGEFARTE